MIKRNTINSYDSKYSHKCSYTPPDVCPYCNRILDPTFVAGYVLENPFDNEGNLYILFFCPRCEDIFIANYSATYNGSIDKYTTYSLNNIYPSTIESQPFSKHISTLSKDFIEIFNQSSEAEKNNLFRICGIGYRKSLEFLIKDYLIYKNPDKEDDIKKLTLGKCINDYLCKSSDNNPFEQRIKILAEKSAWLGNDEAHYIRKHEDKDFNDLKKFIEIIISYINAELIVEEAEAINKK